MLGGRGLVVILRILSYMYTAGFVMSIYIPQDLNEEVLIQ